MANYGVACKCGKIVEIELSYEQVQMLTSSNNKIQDILPFGEYTPEQREMFVTGQCNDCWKKIFPDEDPDEDSGATSAEMELSGGCPDLEDVERKADESAKEDFDAIKYDLNLD